MAGKWSDWEVDSEDCYEVIGLENFDAQELLLWRLENALPAPVSHLHFESGIPVICEMLQPDSIPLWFVCNTYYGEYGYDFELEDFITIKDCNLPKIFSFNGMRGHGGQSSGNSVSNTRIQTVEISKRVP